MKQKLDIDTWKRKAHFRFFSTFEEPFYGVCAAVDCTTAYSFAKSQAISVFLYCLHRSLLAVHRTEPFKYRIENDEVFVYDRIDAAITVARDDSTFGYGHIAYSENLQEFLEGANSEVERVRGLTDLVPSGVNNTILYSALPWIDFTSVSHARKFSFADSRPRITFGKITEKVGKRSMPVSIHVHHALIDGFDVGQYLDCFQAMMNQR
jgi:chloramphenicol O-acetyltransferase type A